MIRQSILLNNAVSRLASKSAFDRVDVSENIMFSKISLLKIKKNEYLDIFTFIS